MQPACWIEKEIELTWCLRVFVVKKATCDLSLPGRARAFGSAGDRNTKGQRSGGDGEIFVVREFLELPIKRVTVGIDPEGDRRFGVGVPQAAEKVAVLFERLVAAFRFEIGLGHQFPRAERDRHGRALSQ